MRTAMIAITTSSSTNVKARLTVCIDALLANYDVPLEVLNKPPEKYQLN
jgi:hypothetical protein